MATVPHHHTCSLLLASVPSLNSSSSLRARLASAISFAVKFTSKRLIILLVSPSFAPNHLPVQWHAIQRLLTFVYVQAAKIANEMDNILLQVDVLLKPPSAGTVEATSASDSSVSVQLDLVSDEIEVLYCIEGDSTVDALQLPSTLRSIPQHTITANSSIEPTDIIHQDTEQQIIPARFPVIALGGTFDHLHAGHKILLSMAAWLASRKLIVGVTDTSLLSGKNNKHLLQSLDVRISRTREFLTLFKPSLTYDVVPINDVYGPTGWDPDVQALVVSKETLSGAKAIAAHRATHNLPPLETFVISVISHEDEDLVSEDTVALRKAKMSSTAIREWIAKKEERPMDQCTV